MITLIAIISILGKKWGEQWVKQGLMTMDDVYRLGYLGCFFGKIFGF